MISQTFGPVGDSSAEETDAKFNSIQSIIVWLLIYYI